MAAGRRTGGVPFGGRTRWGPVVARLAYVGAISAHATRRCGHRRASAQAVEYPQHGQGLVEARVGR